MQYISIILLLALLLLFLVLLKQMHIHASSDKVEHKVRVFLDEHLEAHHAKNVVNKPLSKDSKSSKKKSEK